MNTIENIYFLYKEMYNYRQLLDGPTIPKRDFYNMLFFFFGIYFMHPPNAKSVLPFITTRENKLITEDTPAKTIPRTISFLRVDLSNISSFKLIPLCLYKRIALGRRIRFANIRTKQYTFRFALA